MLFYDASNSFGYIFYFALEIEFKLGLNQYYQIIDIKLNFVNAAEGSNVDVVFFQKKYSKLRRRCSLESHSHRRRRMENTLHLFN